ncbi:MAG: HEAT repeat domain-containing protein, partial [Deltaproteobacteria bacterium]
MSNQRTSTRRTTGFRRSLAGLVLGAAVAFGGQVALAGTGASYASIAQAIASGNPSSIVGEIERAEKLPCGSCIDLVLPLIDHENARVRDVAAWWLAKRAIRTKVRDDMFERLAGTDTIRARNAAEVLGRFAHPDALMALEIAMHEDALGVEARAAAATAIGAIGHPAGKAMLEAALTSEAPEVRAAAAAALRHIRGNTEGLALVEVLDDMDDRVVLEAVRTLGHVRESAAVDALIAVLEDDARPAFVRRDAAWALGKIADGAARDALDRAIREDPSMLV